ncbi:DUF397 domain-containing protein [Actinophytocola sp.]|jgi:uncharacterized protein DUF397|uniref:DUF397 domain-containing protein n=1 Tax=Actinophytocola sp. TaxID=1872138 RepID=UPI002D6F931A|nr:DUF397 domain-containing protein [Actinophytocola sp.]HYQ64357.1 DUF397 domain-containing protein [Actinophytocola sp.]
MDGQFESWIRTHATFAKSSFSEGGDCVEVTRTEIVGVRNSKDPDGPVLLFTRRGWDSFAGLLARD